MFSFHRYFMVLLTLDIIILLTSVSTIITVNGCHHHSYASALYFAHLFFTIFYMLQTFSHYVIVWVSYDRLLALWCLQYFKKTQHPRVIKIRMIVTGLCCVAVNLRHLINVEVECEWNEAVVEAANHSEDCEGGKWIIKDSLHVTGKRDVWQSVIKMVRGLLVIVIPVLLVLVFNMGIVIGLVRRRLFNTAATIRTRDQAYSSIYITLAISFTALVTAMPTIIHAYFFAPNIRNCHGPFNEEVLRASACLLLLGEHLTHFLILAINQIFRVEVKKLLRDVKTCIGKMSGSCFSHCSFALQCFWPLKRLCPCSPCCSRLSTHTEEVVSNAPANNEKYPHSPQVPKIVVQWTEEQPDGKVEDDDTTPKQLPSNFLFSERESYVSETGQSSTRTSMVTLAEEEQK